MLCQKNNYPLKNIEVKVKYKLKTSIDISLAFKNHIDLFTV